MDRDLGFEDFKDDTFEDFPFEDYALETEVKSEVIEQNSVTTEFQEQHEISSTPLCYTELTIADPEILQRASKQEVNLSESENCFESIKNCLSLNHAYQIMIGEALHKLQIALNRNQANQEKLKEEENLRLLMKKRKQKELSHKKPVNLFVAPYFRDVRGRIPPVNEDTKTKRKNNDIDAYLLPPKAWCANEYDKLLHAVKSNVMTVMLEPFKTKRDYLKSKVQNSELTEREEQQILNEITKIEEDVNEVKSRSLDDVLNVHQKKIDWLAVSASYMEGVRSPDECECLWNNYLNPSINKCKFLSQEDAKLSSLAKKYDFHNWDGIAKELSTNRTAIQCFERYQSHLNKDMLRKYWTEEEDNRLKYIVETFQIGDSIPWHKVVYYMDGRTRLQITNRWIRCVDPENKRTPWTEAEDTILYAGVKKFGYQWNKIKDFLPGRSNYTCRERFLNNLIPDLKIGDWTQEEDRILIELIQKHGFGKWSKIYMHLPGRTDNMCLRRAQRIQQHHPSWFKSTAGSNSDGKVRPEKKRIGFTAPSNKCTHWNSRLENIRNAAERNLISVLKKVLGRDDIDDVNKIDLTDCSTKVLHDIRKELIQKENELQITDWKPRYGIFTKKCEESDESSNKSDKEYDSTDEEKNNVNAGENDEVEEEFEHERETASVGKKQKHAEEQYIDEVLNSLFMPHAMLRNKGGSVNKPVALSCKMGAEQSMLKNYLFQSFQCTAKALCDGNDSDEPEDVKFGGVDYAISVPRMIHFFVLPPVDVNEFQVISPNMTTITAMDVLNTTRISLIKCACFLERSKPLLISLTSDISNKSEIKCTFCLNRLQTGLQSASESADQNPHIVEMRKDFMVMDKQLEQAIAYEIEDVVPMPEVCTCDAVCKEKERVTLLRKRFLSLFLWPGLLSNMMPDKDLQIAQSSQATSRATPKQKPQKRKKNSAYSNRKKRNVVKETDETYKVPNAALSKRTDETRKETMCLGESVRRSQRLLSTKKKNYVS